MHVQKMTTKYAYFAITDHDGVNREFIADFDEELDPNDVPEMVQRFKGETYLYYYILVEKQLHPE